MLIEMHEAVSASRGPRAPRVAIDDEPRRVDEVNGTVTHLLRPAEAHPIVG